MSSKGARIRGLGRVPSPEIRAETLALSQEVGANYMRPEFVTLTTSTTSGSSWYDGGSTSAPYQTWSDPWYYQVIPGTFIPSVTTITQIIKEKEVTKEVEKRTLYKVYVVNPKKNGKVLLDGKSVIAINENQAMLKAGIAEIATAEGVDLEQLDVYVQVVGTFIRPKRETQRVKIEKEEE